MDKKDNKIQVAKIPSRSLQLVTMETDEGKKWAIRNKYAEMTPFFENSPFIIYNGDKSILFIGELHGKKHIYTGYDTDGYSDPFYSKVETAGSVIYLKELDDDSNICILTTDKGDYLFDKETLKQKSDVFNTVTCLNNRFIFSKIMISDGRESVYYGDVRTDGSIGRFMYDEDNDDYIVTPIITSDKGFDEIDEFQLDEILSKNSIKRSSVKKAKLKILARLNMAKK